MAAVKQNGRALFYASNKLKDNEEVAMSALKNGGDLLNASRRLIKKRDMIKEAIKHQVV